MYFIWSLPQTHQHELKPGGLILWSMTTQKGVLSDVIPPSSGTQTNHNTSDTWISQRHCSHGQALRYNTISSGDSLQSGDAVEVVDRIQRQMTAFKEVQTLVQSVRVIAARWEFHWLVFYLQGFYELIPQDLIKIFDENELEVRPSALRCVCNFIHLSSQETLLTSLCSSAADVWLRRRGRQRLERKHQI